MKGDCLYFNAFHIDQNSVIESPLKALNIMLFYAACSRIIQCAHLVLILQVSFTKKSSKDYEYDNLMPMVDKIVDATWTKSAHYDKFAHSQGINIVKSSDQKHRNM